MDTLLKILAVLFFANLICLMFFAVKGDIKEVKKQRDNDGEK